MPRDLDQTINTGLAVANVNKLTIAFAKAVGDTQKDKNDNLIVSPFNALTALAMLSKAAAGNTRDELAQTLFGIPGGELDKAVEELAALNADMLASNKDQVTLATANGLWANVKNLKLNKEFAAELQEIFGAEISEEPFSQATVDKINAWAAKNTNSLISKVLEKLDPDAAAVLASALYFKGEWTNKFDVKETEDRRFITDDGSVSNTPTMHKYFKPNEVRYQDGTDYEAVALSYGEQNQETGKAPTMRLVLVRPKDGNVNARDWLASQTALDAPEWLNQTSFSRIGGTVELPHLDMKQTHDLIPALKEMGIRDVFNGRTSNLSRLAEEGRFFVSAVSHDVVFKTDEKGSEAAAVTAITVMRSLSVSHDIPKTFNVKFDRSFVFALQDIKTGAVIFTGAVNKPNNEMKADKNAGPISRGAKVGNFTKKVWEGFQETLPNRKNEKLGL
jgi:serine protease inhibitor